MEVYLAIGLHLVPLCLGGRAKCGDSLSMWEGLMQKVGGGYYSAG